MRGLEDCNKVGSIVIGLLAFFMVCFVACILALAKSGTDSMATKLTKCEEAGYVFVVDGIEVESLDEECINNAYLRYNTIFDDTGKKVVMTTAPIRNSHVMVMP